MAKISGKNRGAANLIPGGRPGNKGGTGRPPDWLKNKCANLLEKYKLWDWLAEVAKGEFVDRKTVAIENGKTSEIACAANIKDRLRAMEMLADRGHGKAPIGLEVGDGHNVFKKVVIELSA